jgi:hypothetical protein
VFIPPLSQYLPQVASPGTLHRVWDELEYRLDICRVTGGVSVRFVQDFESFSIDWCTYEVLIALYSFSLSF